MTAPATPVSPTPVSPAPVPPAPVSDELGQRFFKAFDAFVAAVRAAINSAVGNPAYSSAPGFVIWQTSALPRLERDLAQIQDGYALFQIGETGTLSRLARAQLGIAKQLDGFPFDFAGPDRAKVLEQFQEAIVFAAFELSKAQGVL